VKTERAAGTENLNGPAARDLPSYTLSSFQWALWANATSTEQKRNNKQDKEQEEQDLRDPCCRSRYSRKAQESRNQSDHKKCDGPT